MTKKLTVLMLAGALALCAQGKGRGNAGGMGQGNAGGMGMGRGNDRMSEPAQNPHSNGRGVSDRDFGRDRAEDVGKGKKQGFSKTHHKKHRR